MTAQLWLRHHLAKTLRAEVLFTDLPLPSHTWTVSDFRSDPWGHISGNFWIDALDEAQAQADAAVMSLHDCDETCEAWYRVI